MTKTHKIELDTLLLFILAAGVGIASAFYSGQKTFFHNSISLPSSGKLASVPLTSPAPFAPQSQTATQISPDGTKLLTLTTVTNADRSRTYTFVTSEADGSNKQTVYTGTDPSGSMDSLSIPFNTWSPNDTYIFVTRKGKAETQALAMRADGQSLTENSPDTNITTVFDAQKTGNTYQETTGWASDNLLIVNTTTSSGMKGPSYWLEMPDNSLMQLGTQF